eukprot:jgi/Chlat1/2186/Chrsp17S02748
MAAALMSVLGPRVWPAAAAAATLSRGSLTRVGPKSRMSDAMRPCSSSGGRSWRENMRTASPAAGVHCVSNSSSSSTTTKEEVEEKEKEKDDKHRRQPMPSIAQATGLMFASMACAPAMAQAAAAEKTSVTAAAAAATNLGPALSPLAVQVLSVLPPACFLFMQLSGFKTVAQIKADRSVGNLSPLPFVSLATNCLVWTLYGVLKSDLTVLAPNVSGLLFGTYYTYVFATNSSQSLNKYYAGAAGVAAAAAGMATMLSAPTSITGIGLLGCTMAIILMGSPLAAMSTVIKEKSTASMPFAMSLATFCNAMAWSAYGALVAHDPMIYVPNGIGLSLATIQMALFAMYGIAKSAPVVREAEELVAAGKVAKRV